MTLQEFLEEVKKYTIGEAIWWGEHGLMLAVKTSIDFWLVADCAGELTNEELYDYIDAYEEDWGPVALYLERPGYRRELDPLYLNRHGS